ncbi:MAG: four helix bundle protein [Nitrospirota bacterium]
MGKNGFRDLIVWQKAKDLAINIYKETGSVSFSHDFSLKDQIRRSAVSIASNIAEGDERNTDKESVRFLYIAKGSLAELQTQLQIAFEIDYIREDKYAEYESECDNLGRMIGKLIKSRKG